MPPGIVLRLDPHAVFRIIRLGIEIVLRRLRSFPSPGKDRELDLFSSFLRFFLLPALIPLFLRGPGALFLRESLDSERGGSAVLRRIFLLSALPPSDEIPEGIQNSLLLGFLPTPLFFRRKVLRLCFLSLQKVNLRELPFRGRSRGRSPSGLRSGGKSPDPFLRLSHLPRGKAHQQGKQRTTRGVDEAEQHPHKEEKQSSRLSCGLPEQKGDPPADCASADSSGGTLLIDFPDILPRDTASRRELQKGPEKKEKKKSRTESSGAVLILPRKEEKSRREEKDKGEQSSQQPEDPKLQVPEQIPHRTAEPEITQKKKYGKGKSEKQKQLLPEARLLRIRRGSGTERAGSGALFRRLPPPLPLLRACPSASSRLDRVLSRAPPRAARLPFKLRLRFPFLPALSLSCHSNPTCCRRYPGIPSLHSQNQNPQPAPPRLKKSHLPLSP